MMAATSACSAAADFSAEAARFGASLPACGAGVSFSGFGGKGAAMISTASSSM